MSYQRWEGGQGWYVFAHENGELAIWPAPGNERGTYTMADVIELVNTLHHALDDWEVVHGEDEPDL